jgi:hypothetical protein
MIYNTIQRDGHCFDVLESRIAMACLGLLFPVPSSKRDKKFGIVKPAIDPKR